MFRKAFVSSSLWNLFFSLRSNWTSLFSPPITLFFYFFRECRFFSKCFFVFFFLHLEWIVSSLQKNAFAPFLNSGRFRLQIVFFSFFFVWIKRGKKKEIGILYRFVTGLKTGASFPPRDVRRRAGTNGSTRDLLWFISRHCPTFFLDLDLQKRH